VNDPVLTALRDRVETHVDPTLGQDQARVKIRLKNGTTYEKFVAHAVGSVENPMTDDRLNAKFSDLVAGILPDDRARKLMDLCWAADRLENAGDIARAAAG
jgi:2-methylcitrate dehydratase PrpD